jgi:multiple sugar transport system ATP-binding protein
MATVTFDHVTKAYADGTIAVDDLDLLIKDGEFLVLVGPSGCGKTTALRCVAGLEEITGGQIKIDARVVNRVPSKDRNIAMVFQSYALYPHMTVFDNLAFGLKLMKTPKQDIKRRVEEAAKILNLESLLDRKPRALSGGQRQRVALGRAIVREPAAFLMDEPLSNLDAKLRVQTRAEILKLQRELDTTTIYVTHDQVEAMTMGDRIAVMRLGILQQVGSPEELYEQPANVFVAGFIGSPAMNLVPANVLEGVGGDDRIAGFRPEHIRSGKNGAGGDTIAFDGNVEVVEYLGDEQLVHFARKDQSLAAKLPVEDKVSAGDNVTFVLPRSKLYLFDAETEERIAR